MAARWLGLSGSHQRPSRRRVPLSAAVPYRSRGFWQRPTVIALRTLGWTGALACAFAFNTLAFRDFVAPNAYASIMFANIKDPPALVTPDPDEVHLLAATMWGEARSEGEDGMRAVAHVMVNRVGPRFGSDLRTVIMAPKQFSAWNRGDPNRPLVQNPEHYAKGDPSWDVAQRVAYEVLSGASVDPTQGALFYHTRAVHPSWSRYGENSKIIGAHIFYRDVPDRAFRVASVRRAAVAHSTGPRAGRVRGVIQHAPWNTNAPPPVTVIDTSTQVTPPELADAIANL